MRRRLISVRIAASALVGAAPAHAQTDATCSSPAQYGNSVYFTCDNNVTYVVYNTTAAFRAYRHVDGQLDDNCRTVQVTDTHVLAQDCESGVAFFIYRPWGGTRWLLAE